MIYVHFHSNITNLCFIFSSDSMAMVMLLICLITPYFNFQLFLFKVPQSRKKYYFHIVFFLLFCRDVKSSISSDKEDSSLAQLLQDTDPNIAGNSPGRNIQLDHSPGTQRSQYQQSKFLDGGGNFVDPNKVLPGHFAGKGTLRTFSHLKM